MTSLVTDVLYSAGKLSKEDLPCKVENLKKKVEDIKIEIQEILSNCYIKFVPQYVKLDKVTSNLMDAVTEYDNLYNQIEKEIKPQMSGSVAEFHEMLEDLKKVNTLNDAVENLVEMHKNLESAKTSISEKMYLDATKYIKKFESDFKKTLSNINGQKDIEIYCALNEDFIVAKERIIYRLKEAWDQCISINISEGRGNCENKISVTFNVKPIEKTLDMLYSLNQINYLNKSLEDFGKRFLNLICESLVSRVVEIEDKSTDESSMLVILVLKEETEGVKNFNHLIEIFNFLHLSFFKYSVNSEDSDEETCKETVMKRFGNLIGKDFCTLLIEKCVKKSVPNQSKDLKKFQKIIEQVVDLQKHLLNLRFFESDDNLLISFLKNVDTLPANQMAQDILRRARDLMKQDLHKTLDTGVEAQAYLNTTIAEVTGDLNYMVHMKGGLSKESFAFPACQISVFAKDLVKLLHEVMQEAQNATSPYSLKLYYTARNICELYCSVVPVYHKEAIIDIPQQTAIHHNNSMYIAHCLCLLGSQYKLDSTLPVTFVDLVNEVRKVGTEAFLAQMRKQRQLLMQLLQEPDVFQNVVGDENFVSKREKSVHQCLYQLQLLKKVWADVLPTEIYFKAIGTLLNTCLEEIILHIMSMEDIAAQTAAQFDSMFDIILKQAPELFKASVDKSDSVHKYVRKWFRFIELQLVLGASLREIVNRWSSGKGPLATHFAADEVKHLIRALFQNTERRAAALGKIYVAS